MSPFLSILSVSLPIINCAGFVQFFRTATSSPNVTESLRRFRVSFCVLVLVVLDTVFVTLAGTYLPPETLSCPLVENWEGMFRAHDGTHIKAIQDSLGCCGLKTTKHMPFPFPDINGAGKCVEMNHRSQSCLAPWKQETQRVAGMFLAIGLTLGLAKIISLLLIHRINQLPSPANKNIESALIRSNSGDNNHNQRIQEIDSDFMQEIEEGTDDGMDEDDREIMAVAGDDSHNGGRGSRRSRRARRARASAGAAVAAPRNGGGGTGGGTSERTPLLGHEPWAGVRSEGGIGGTVQPSGLHQN